MNFYDAFACKKMILALMVIQFLFLLFIFTLHAQCKQGKVIGIGVHIYMYVMLYLWTKIYLNHTLAIDSPFKHSQ